MGQLTQISCGDVDSTGKRIASLEEAVGRVEAIVGIFLHRRLCNGQSSFWHFLEQYEAEWQERHDLASVAVHIRQPMLSSIYSSCQRYEVLDCS
jgi:hypothetical protein